MKYHYENGDIQFFAGHNKKELIDGKLKCSRCKRFKEIKDFVTNSQSCFGVKGVCKVCYNKGRRKS